jgi:hypothetical protein
MNLATNAIHAMPTGGTLVVALEVFHSESGNRREWLMQPSRVNEHATRPPWHVPSTLAVHAGNMRALWRISQDARRVPHT